MADSNERNEGMNNAAGMRGTQMARALAARRRTVTKLCESCGTEIIGVVTRRFCSAACRLRAARKRRDGGAVSDRLAAVDRLFAIGDELSHKILAVDAAGALNAS